MASEFNPSFLTKVERLRRLARLLDAAVVIPGTKFRVGLDPFLGLVPGVGDAVTAAVGGYLIYEAARMGVPRPTLLRMLANLGIDFLAGSVPIVGDLFDAAWRSNLRNADLLADHVKALQAAAEKKKPPRPRLLKRWLQPSA